MAKTSETLNKAGSLIRGLSQIFGDLAESIERAVKAGYRIQDEVHLRNELHVLRQIGRILVPITRGPADASVALSYFNQEKRDQVEEDFPWPWAKAMLKLVQGDLYKLEKQVKRLRGYNLTILDELHNVIIDKSEVISAVLKYEPPFSEQEMDDLAAFGEVLAHEKEYADQVMRHLKSILGKEEKLFYSESFGSEQDQTKTIILVLASSPMNEARLRLDKEVREIDEGLRRSKKRDQFMIEQRWAIRTDDLRRALLDIEPQIVHFSGHGAGDDGIVVEDDNGNSKLINTEALASLFELCADHVECVLLNACYSEIQANTIAQHIDHVIGMRQAIGDTASIKFAVGFYDALGAGKPVEIAYKFGCNAIQIENIPEHLTPQIKKRSQSE